MLCSVLGDYKNGMELKKWIF